MRAGEQLGLQRDGLLLEVHSLYGRGACGADGGGGGDVDGSALLIHRVEESSVTLIISLIRSRRRCKG